MKSRVIPSNCLRRRALISSIEPLEARIAPASVVTYTDIDGDKVTIKSTAGDLTAAGVMHLSAGANQQLQELNVADPSFNGASITITVVKAAGGDGLAAVGLIAGGTNDFGKITIAGDLAAIDCSSIETLGVRSMGIYGEATQDSTLSPTLESDITGSAGLGALKVIGDVKDVIVHAIHAIGPVTIGGSLIGDNLQNGGVVFSEGTMGMVKIGGNVETGGIAANGALLGAIVGGSLIGGDNQSSGEIAAGSVGKVKIGGDVQGGAGLESGMIGSATTLDGVIIGGSLIGGAGQQSGAVAPIGGAGPVTVNGNIVGGAGANSGRIISNGNVGNVTVHGSMIGGGGSGSGSVSSGLNLGAVSIGHDVQGGAGDHTGFIDAGAALAGVTVGGSLIGGGSGAATDSGEIASTGNMGAIKIGHDVVGGPGAQFCGIIQSGAAIASVTVGGSLIGGGTSSSQDSGEIYGVGDLGAVKIGHDVKGGGGAQYSGEIDSNASMANVTIGGSLVGGNNASGSHAGEIDAMNIGFVKIGHDMLGGAASESGEIETGALAGVSIGGSLIGGPNSASQNTGLIFSGDAMGMVTIGHDLQGGAGMFGGVINSNGALAGASVGGSVIGGPATTTGFISGTNVGMVKIGHDLRGGSLPSGSTDSISDSGVIDAEGHLTGVSIGGSIISGTNDGTGTLTLDGAIVAKNDIGSIAVKGNVTGSVGSAGAVTKALLSASVPAASTGVSNVAIGKITIGGRVEQTQILAGYDTTLTAVSGNAQIGSVTVGGNWIASDLVAGVQEANAATGFGGSGDTIIGNIGNSVARIASIVIKGIVEGTPGAGDQFGFESHAIGSVNIDGAAITLPTAPGSLALSPITGGDVTLRLI